MSDRFKGCTVVFDREIRAEDAETLLNAIRMIKGVQIVEPSIRTPDDWMAESKGRLDVLTSLADWLRAQYKK